MHISNGPGTDAAIKNKTSADTMRIAGSEKTHAKTRILVLEEQPLLCYGISAYLNSQPDIIVCGEADSIPDARNKLAECEPDVLLTPVRLGTGNSFEFVKALKAEKP